MSIKSQDLATLGALKAKLKAEAPEHPFAPTPKERMVVRPVTSRAKVDDKASFAAQMKQLGVEPLKVAPRVELKKPKTVIRPKQEVWEESLDAPLRLSDELDTEAFHQSDCGRGFYREWTPPDSVKRLLRNSWPIGAHLDLHGYTVDEARSAYQFFIEESLSRGVRCVRIVHGVGYHSEGILKTLTTRWLKQTPAVLAYAQATMMDGGEGAVLVLLAKV